MANFFTADTHFDHKNVLKYRSIESWTIEEMNETVIENINDIASAKDTLYHLGDVGFNKKKLPEHLRRIKARIVLVRGNHDHLTQEARECLSDIRDYLVLKSVFPVHSVLMHYPIQLWDRKRYGAWHLHGHTHGQIDNSTCLRLDVGIDSAHHFFGEFRPFAEEEIVAILEERREYMMETGIITPGNPVPE